MAAFAPARPIAPVGRSRSRPGSGRPALFVKQIRREIGYVRAIAIEEGLRELRALVISPDSGARRANRPQFAPLFARGWARVRSDGYQVLRSEWRPRRNGRKTPRPPTSLSPHLLRGPPRALICSLCRQAAQ